MTVITHNCILTQYSITAVYDHVHVHDIPWGLSLTQYIHDIPWGLGRDWAQILSPA